MEVCTRNIIMESLDERYEIIEKIIKDNTDDINKKNYNLQTALMITEDERITELLLKHGADPNLEDSCGCIALHYSRKPSQIDMLVKFGANINKKDAYGWTPLMTVVARSSTEQMKILLEAGADANIKSKPWGCKAIHYCRSIETVLTLLDYGVDIYTIDENNSNLLDYIRGEVRYTELERFLIEEIGMTPNVEYFN